MKIIKRKVKLLAQILGEAKFRPGDRLREIKFILRTPVEGGSIIHNTFTGEMLFVADGEDAEEYLRKNWFYVTEDFDERKLVRETRELYKLIFFGRRDGISSYTILPTSDCNARCFYCYELGCEKMVMDEKIAHDTADYIVRHQPSRFEEDEIAPFDEAGIVKDDNSVRLSWFGGEPLYNSAAIDTICGDLKARGISYKSTMISNAYLFDEDLVDKAVGLWNLKNIQITLDGTQDVYNDRKAFIYEGNAFERVIRNIGLLLDAGVRVRIRLNLDEDNYEDLCRLCDYLSDKFCGYEKFSVYAHVLFQIINEGNEERLNALYIKRAELLKHIKKADTLKAAKKLCLSYLFCMADNPFSVVILPDGRLHSCEHFNEGLSWGNIYGDDTKLTPCHPDGSGGMITPLEFWAQMEEDLPECEQCRIYPSCLRAKHCADKKDERCMSIERDYIENSLHNAARLFYSDYLKAEQNA